MAFLGQPFDPNTVPPAEDFAPWPSGEYPAMIIDSEMKQTKAGNGSYLALTFQAIDGPMKNRLVWANLNLDNQNPKAVEIAQRELSSICAACGVTSAITDSQQLHNIPMQIRVEFVPAGPKSQRDSNQIKAYKRLEGAVAPPASSTSAAAPAQAAAAVPPWKRAA